MASARAPELPSPVRSNGESGLEQEQLLRFVTGCRWFAGKGRRAELLGLTRLPWLSTPGAWPAIRFEIAEMGYPDEPAAGTELYSVPMSYWPSAQPGLAAAAVGTVVDPELGPVEGYDAMRDPTACRLLLGGLLTGQQARGATGQVRCHATAVAGLSDDLEPQPFTGQQSNSSVSYGGAAMLKLFRRLELGHNLDIEVHDALSRAGNADVARLYGWLDASWVHAGQPVHADLAMVVEKFAEAAGGWELALAAARDQHDFTAAAEQLGAALAETHAGLRQAFPVGHRSGAEVAAQMRQRLASAERAAPALTRYATRLQSCFAALATADLATQRVHGDFHLGQTLQTPAGWKIIDFEGEPAKSLAERAQPDSRWRDVAGMLRSFGYAAATEPTPTSERWLADCRAALLRGYVGGPLAPADQAMLRAYEADKAIYEVVYEVRNRPEWVRIPLEAVAALAAEDGPRTGTDKE